MADFIQTFSQLSAPQRRHALALLPAHLTPYEWRDLHAILSTRQFHTDIIGRLPHELVAHVFSYLDPAAPYRFRSVCSRWLQVLQSLDVLKAALGSWYPGELPLRDADYALCLQLASQIHKFRTGRPASVYKMALNSRLHMAAPSLCGDHLVWIPTSQQGPRPRSACMLNLHTWQLRRLAGDGREALLSIVASDQIVMLSTMTNFCYVYQVHHDGPPKKFRLPSIQFLKYLHCHGRTIACVASYETHTSVFIWDYDTQHGKSFDISYSPDSMFAGWSSRDILHIAPLVQPQTETISLLFVADDPTVQTAGQTLFVLATYTFRGECVSCLRPSLPHMDQISFWPAGTDFVPADDSSTLFTVRLTVQGTDPNSNHSRLATLPLQFNVKTRDLTIFKGLELHGPIPQVCFTHSLASWKDTCYGFQVDSETTKGDMITYMGTCDTAAHVPVVSEPKCIHDGSDTSYVPLFLLNEKYAIRIVPETLYLACFHQNTNRPTADGAFFDMGSLVVQY